jgi:hypothetical protein
MPIVGSTAYGTARTITGLARALLNDIGINGYPVPIASAVRATNIVTVTTQIPHGLVTGDTDTVAGVTGGATSFNGRFIITYVGPTSFTYSQTGGNESATANTGTSSGQQDNFGVGTGVIFPDFVLMPYANSAYRTTQRAMAMSGSPLFRIDNAELVVAAVSSADPSVQVVVNDSTAAPNQLPTDLIEPVKLWERQSGSSDAFVEMSNLTYTSGLPSRTQGQRLLEWEWRADGLYFVGATIDTQIRIRYRKALAYLIDGTSTILIRNSEETLAYFTAANAAAARGAPQAQTWETMADDALEKLIAAAVRQQQFSPRRRRPYSYRSAGVGPTF